MDKKLHLFWKNLIDMKDTFRDHSYDIPLIALACFTCKSEYVYKCIKCDTLENVQRYRIVSTS